jgi:hypothetical protein
MIIMSLEFKDPIDMDYIAWVIEETKADHAQLHTHDKKFQMALSLASIPGAMNGRFKTSANTYLDAEDREQGLPKEKPIK